MPFEIFSNAFGTDRPAVIDTRSVEDIYWRIAKAPEWGPWMRKPKPLAWCSHCMEEDLDAQGWAAWHVMHQVHFLHDCPVHRAPLFTHCLGCGQVKDDGTQWRLPSSNCDVCGARRFAGHDVPSSDGYTALMQNMDAFYSAKSAPFTEEAWAENMSTVQGRMPRYYHAHKALRRALEDRWGVKSVEQIPGELKVQEWYEWFESAFHWKYSKSPLVRLLFYDALVSAGLWDSSLLGST
jgi:hypothetical protein